MGAGSLLQLAVAGSHAEEYSVRGPTMTFWNGQSHRRHTPFALETIEVSFDSQPTVSHSDGGTFRAKIGRHGDLLRDAIVSFELPSIYSGAADAFQWSKYPGLALLESASFYVDNQVIDVIYPEFEVVYNNSLESEKKGTTNALVGHVDAMYAPRTEFPIMTITNNNASYVYYPDSDELGVPSILGRRLFVPLRFFFTRSTKLALPLISMQYSSAYIELKFRPLGEIFRVREPTDTTGTKWTAPGTSQTLSKFVDASVDVKPYNLRATMFMTYVNLGISERTVLAKSPRLDYFVDVIRHERINGIKGSGNYSLRQFNHTIKAVVWMFVRSDARLKNVFSDYARIEGTDSDPMVSCGLSINGILREESKPAYFYSKIQGHNHTQGGSLPTGVYMYSFALSPFDDDPSGSIALSAAGSLQFRLEMAMPEDDPDVTYDMLVFGITSNIFRVSSGSAGIVYV